jgi:5'-nucleotidase
VANARSLPHPAFSTNTAERFEDDDRVRILVTNDDGIDSLGLHILARALRGRGEVVAFGAPFDLVVAGINPGANVGRAVYHSGTVGAALTARRSGMSGVAVSQAVADGGVEGQGWDDMLADQRWPSAAAAADAVVGALLASPPEAPVVVNINVPNVDLDQVRGWRYTSVGRVPPRTVEAVQLQPKQGHEGAFHVRMRWGEAVVLPPETDGGAVGRDYIAVSYLSAINAEHSPDIVATAGALDHLLGSNTRIGGGAVMSDRGERCPE